MTTPSTPIERNDTGAMLLDIDTLAKSIEDRQYPHSRYNGGYYKHITGIDKKHTDGYSLKGEFVNTGLTWLAPGVYLDCSIGGSRKRQERTYAVFTLEPDGSVHLIAEETDRRDYAPRLWSAIEVALTAIEVLKREALVQQAHEGTLPDSVPTAEILPPTDLDTLASISDSDLIAELQRRGYSTRKTRQPEATGAPTATQMTLF